MNELETIKDNTVLRPTLALASNRPQAHGTVIPTTDTISPSDLFGSIWRNKRLILSIMLIFLGLAWLILSVVPPRYTSDAQLMLESPESNDAGVMSFLADPSISDGAIVSEIEVIKSRGLAGKVIKLLHLESNPEFNTLLQGAESDPLVKAVRLLHLEKVPGFDTYLQSKKPVPEPFDPDKYFPDLVQLSSGAPADMGDDSFNPDEAVQVAALLKVFDDGLSVTRNGKSRVIRIEFSAKNPITATKIVNTIVDQYILQQREMKFVETGKAASWLDERIAPLQKKVEQSETAVERYRKSSGLLQSNGTTLTSQNLAELNNQMVQAEKNYDETNARLRQIAQLLSTPKGAETISAVQKSPLIQHLRVQEAGLQQKISEASTQYGNLHPIRVQLKEELNSLNERIKQEVLNISRNLRNEAAIARAQKASAQTRLDQLKEEVAKSNRANVELRALEREAQANRALLESFLARSNEASTQKDMDIQQPNARILSRAITPVIPSFPKKVPILALTLFGSALLAILFVLVRESMDHGLYTVGLVEEHTGVGSLGYIPAVRKTGGFGKSPESYRLDRPRSLFAGAIRTLYTRILLSSPDNPPRSILVTSTQQKEGKTTIANALAISRSLAGQKTIIVDTDLRIANVNNAFNVKTSPGLVELLGGEAAVEEVIYQDPNTGTYILPAGALTQNSADLLLSENMDTLMTMLYDAYDLVILDSPPVMDTPDARILMSRVDATVFIAKWNDTKRQLVREALRHIATPGNNIIGLLLNMVDVGKQASYGYGGSDHTQDQLNQKFG